MLLTQAYEEPARSKVGAIILLTQAYEEQASDDSSHNTYIVTQCNNTFLTRMSDEERSPLC